jgi:site-specific DNA recombinase
MKAAIYCRVSTEDQGREGTSLQSQREACVAKASNCGYEIADDLIFKETFSGLTLERIQLSLLREKAKQGDFQAVIVYTPDRLCRNGEDILAIAKELKSLGIKLLFVKEQWDDTLNGKLIGFMLGWSSEFEAAQIKERTQRGKQTLLKKGILPQGTGKGLYGYDWDKELRKRVPKDFEARVVQNIFGMIGEGQTYLSVAEKLNATGIATKSGGKWHPLTIKRMVANQGYIGITQFGRTRRIGKKVVVNQNKEDVISLRGVTPPIITRELFEQAQLALTWPRSRTGKANHQYLLTGHIRCGKCGSPMVGSALRGGYLYYYCTGARTTINRGPICDLSYIRTDKIDPIVWGKVREILEDPQVIIAELQRQVADAQGQVNDSDEINREIRRLRTKIGQYESQKKRVMRLFAYKDTVTEDDILDQLRDLKQECEADQERLRKLKQREQSVIEFHKAEIRLDKLGALVSQNLDHFSFEDKRMALNALDVNVTARPDKVEIRGTVPADYVTIVQTSA